MTNADEANESYNLTDDEVRESYNMTILEEAMAFQSANERDGAADHELDAQVETVQNVWAMGDTARLDSAIDHLRAILAASYVESDEDLPLVVARRGDAVAPAGAPDEVFEISFQWTRAQIDSIYKALETIADYSNGKAEERAVEILLGAIPQAAHVDHTEWVDVDIQQVDAEDVGSEPVVDFEIALTAMREVLGRPRYGADRVQHHLGGGVWRVALPPVDLAELKANRFWGRDANGYDVSVDLDA